jgi:hypothetical protein
MSFRLDPGERSSSPSLRFGRILEAEGELRVRILLTAAPEAERDVRHRIDLALSGQ